MTSIWSHEGYGHILFEFRGLPSCHGQDKSLTEDIPSNNLQLEQQIKKSETEAEKHYDEHNKESINPN